MTKENSKQRILLSREIDFLLARFQISYVEKIDL